MAGLPDQSHTYTTAGSYDVTQTAVGAGGSTQSAPQTVTVSAPVSTVPIVRATSKATNSAVGDTSITFTMPAGIVSGDLLVIVLTQRSNNPTFTTPSGWTMIPKLTQTGENICHIVYYKTAGSTNASATVGSTGTTAMLGTLYVFQVNTFNTVDPFAVDPTGWWTASGTNTTIPSITTPTANSVQIAQSGRYMSTSTPNMVGSGTGWTVDAEWDSGTSPALGPTDNNLAGLSEHRTLATAGASSTATISTASGQNAYSGVTFAIASGTGDGGGGGGGGTFGLAGDPGSAKLYISWDQNTQGAWTEFQGEQTRLQNIAYIKNGTTIGASAARKAGIYRSWRTNDGGGATSLIGGSATTSRTIVQTGKIFFKCWEWTAAEAQAYVNNDPTYTSWVSSLVTNFNECRTLGYTGSFWLQLANDPANGGYSAATAAERAALRAAHRKLYVDLKITGGCTNVSLVSPTVVMNDWANSAANFNSGAPVGAGVYRNWWEWHPDWKGTFTGWASGTAPNPDDFYIQYSSTASQTRTVDIFGAEAIDYHAIGSVTQKDPSQGVWSWSSTPNATVWNNMSIYERHVVFSPGRNGGGSNTDRHLLDMRIVLDALYGANVAPILLTRFAYSTFERSAGNPGLPETLSLWDVMIQDMANNNVKGVIWRQGSDTADPAVGDNIHILGAKYTIGAQTKDDGDTRRKALANWMDSTYAKNI